MFEQEPVVVTGGAGFIGGHLVRQLAAEGFTPIVVDTMRLDDAYPRVAHAVGDDHLDRFLRELRPRVIVHLASITDSSLRDRERMIRSNVGEFRRLLETARAIGARVVYASSAAVYGNGPSPMREGQEPRPHTPYAVSKLLLERLAERYARRHGMSLLGLRFFNVFGPGEVHKGRAASMIHQVLHAIRDDRAVTLYRDGEQTRDFVYVADAVAAVIAGVRSNETGIVNVGSGIETSFNQIVRTMERLLERRARIEYLDLPAFEYQARTVAATERLMSMLSVRPRYTPEAGMTELVARSRES